MPRRKFPIRMLYLDIETTPHEGTFWNLFPKYIPINQLKKATELLSWAAKWEGEREIIYRSSNDSDCITKMWDLLNEADCVVHYNGTSFDMKHLNREFVVRGLPPPSKYDQIDLLKTVRKQLKLASNKLDYVARVFGLGSKIKHEGIELWYKCINGCSKAWAKMERYNKQDVKLLPALYKKLIPWIHNHPNLGMWIEDPKGLVCPTCVAQKGHEQIEDYRSKTQSYNQYRCGSCGTTFRERSTNKKASSFLTVRTG